MAKCECGAHPGPNQLLKPWAKYFPVKSIFCPMNKAVWNCFLILHIVLLMSKAAGASLGLARKASVRFQKSLFPDFAYIYFFLGEYFAMCIKNHLAQGVQTCLPIFCWVKRMTLNHHVNDDGSIIVEAWNRRKMRQLFGTQEQRHKVWEIKNKTRSKIGH